MELNAEAAPPPTQDAQALLAVRDLTVSFGTRQGWHSVVSNVSLSVAPGEIVGIVGESGCGKSVTALSILRLMPMRYCRIQGEIMFEGRDIAKISEREMRQVRGRRIGMIFQEPMSALDPVFTVGEQIGETVRTHFKATKTEARERAINALAAVGIADPALCCDSFPMALSGGMRQRVMIAMALVCEPRLLIADEPTTALDVTVQAQIVELLLELSRNTGTALLFITHNLGLVAESCSRMVTMYAGQVVEGGQVDDILTQPLHPYTSGLLRSLPRLSERKTVLPSIPGRVPAPWEMPAGCRFAPRCGFVGPECAAPQELMRHGEHAIRCARHEALTLPGALA